MLLGCVLLAALPGVAPALAAPLNDCVSSDNGDPILTSFVRTPAAVDVTAGSKRVFLTLRVADLGGPGMATGLSSVLVGLEEAPSIDEPFAPYVELKPSATGAWVGSLLVSRWRKPGRVPLGVTLVDKADNYRFLEPKDLTAAGFSAQVMVTSTPDTTAPKLTSLRITPKSLDTRRSPRTLTITARARDTQSQVANIGVSGALGSQALTRDPDGTITLTKVAGTANKFKATTRVPRWVGTGTWKVDLVWIEDRIGNVATYSYRRLGRLGFDRSLKVLSRRDDGRPTVKRFSLKPTAVDVRAASRKVTVSLRAADARSGIQSVEASFWDRDGGWSPTMHRVGGTRRNGIWKGVLTVPRCTGQTGALRVVVDVSDGAGNTRSYGSASLAANGWPNKVAVTADDHSAPLAFVSESVPLAGPIRVDFSESVNGIRSDSIIVRRLFGNEDVFTNGPVVSGTWACINRSRAVTNCETGRVRVARFTPTQPLAASRYYSVTPNPEFSLTLTDLAGNPVEREENILQATR